MFEIVNRGVVVGHSMLEHFEDGMAVAHGRFMPTPAYAHIRPRVASLSEARNRRITDDRVLPLEIRCSNGEVLLTSFAYIDDVVDVHVDPEITVQVPDREQWERCTNGGGA